MKRWRLRLIWLRLIRESIALALTCLGALVVVAAMKFDEDTVIDFLRASLEKAEDG